MQISVRSQTAAETTLSWQPVAGAACYRILWSDRPGETVRFKTAGESGESLFTFCRSTHIPYYIKVQALAENGALLEESTPVQTPVGRVLQQQLEALSRGLVAVTANTGVFISWRLFKSEVTGHNATGLTGTDFVLYKNGVRLATVTDSTNYLDAQGTSGDSYAVAPLVNGVEGPACRGVKPWQKGYYELPLQKPADGVTPAGEPFAHHANDMSVGDIDNDGEYEYFVKWDPDNSHDVSIKGYTGRCFIDCYKLDGTLVWRLDMGQNIRAGAHYTQFMVFDLDGDGKAEVVMKTADGTVDGKGKVIGDAQADYRNEQGRQYITMPQKDLDAGYSHADNYVCTAQDYRLHMAEVFRRWHTHPEVVNGRWPATVEQCFGLAPQYAPAGAFLDADLAVRRLHGILPPRERIAVADADADAERRGVTEDRAEHGLAVVLPAHAGEQDAGAVFLHADGRCVHIQRARGKQLLHGEADGLRRHVVEIAGKLEDATGAFLSLSEHGAHAVCRLKVLRAHAIAGFFHAHGRQRAESRDEAPQKRGPGRRTQLAANASAVDGNALEQKRGRRSGNGKNAVRAAHLAAADVDRGGQHPFRSQQLHQQAHARYVGQRVERADLMEVDLLDRDAVNAAFRVRD